MQEIPMLVHDYRDRFTRERLRVGETQEIFLNISLFCSIVLLHTRMIIPQLSLHVWLEHGWATPWKINEKLRRGWFFLWFRGMVSLRLSSVFCRPTAHIAAILPLFNSGYSKGQRSNYHPINNQVFTGEFQLRNLLICFNLIYLKFDWLPLWS